MEVGERVGSWGAGWKLGRGMEVGERVGSWGEGWKLGSGMKVGERDGSWGADWKFGDSLVSEMKSRSLRGYKNQYIFRKCGNVKVFGNNCNISQLTQILLNTGSNFCCLVYIIRLPIPCLKM
jgi:hypothetical protein